MSVKKLTGSLYMWLVLRAESPSKQTKWNQENHKRENILFPGLPCATQKRLWGFKASGSHCSTSAPRARGLEALPREMYNSPLHATTHMLICYHAIYFYERVSSTNTLIEEKCDRCGIRHQVFPVLVTIRFLITLCSFKIENVLSVLVLWYSPPIYHHNRFLFYFSSCFLLQVPICRWTWSLGRYSLWQ